MKKSIFLFLAAILCATSAWAVNLIGGEVLYLKPNNNWTSDNAWFAMYLCNGTSSAQWVKMTKDGDYYKATVPASKNHKNVIFCRMNKNDKNKLDWSNVWNQTDDLTYDGKKSLYRVKEGAWSKGDGDWACVCFEGFTIYFDIRNATNWQNPHLRIGRTDWNAAYQLQPVQGTKYLYYVSTPNWLNYEAYTIANNRGWTDGNTIYQPSSTKPDGVHAISKLLNYEHSDILGNKYILASKKEKDEHDAEYWQYSIDGTLPSYKVSYSKTGAGTLTVTKYTGSKYEALASGSSVQPTQIIKIETNAECKLTVTGATQIDGGNTYYVTEATTIKAEFASVAKFAGELTDWADHAKSFTTKEDAATLELELTQGKHKFKIIETAGDKMFWHGNPGTTSRKNCTDWIFDQDANATINADVAGTYILTWDFVANKLTITYPKFPDLSNQPDIIYFQPSERWTDENARFAAYFMYGNEETDDKWENLTDTDSDGVYEVNNAKQHIAVIIVRMNPTSTENRWNTDAENNSADKPVWNQSADLYIPMDGNNWFKMTPKNNNEWDNSGEWMPYIQLVDGDNSETLEKYDGKKVNAQVKRTFVADDGYYTICLPFDLLASEIGKAYQVTSITEHVAEKGFNMVFSEVSTLQAGQPYLILPKNLTDPIFKDVTISYNDKNKSETVVHAEGAGINFDMIGKINGAGKTDGLYWVGTNGYFYNDNTDILGLRTYFSITDNAGKPLNIRARVVVSENAATGLDNITNGENTTIKVIENGQLIIIRNGEKFNAQGQKL